MSDLQRNSAGTPDSADDQELVTCVLDNIEFGLNIHVVQEIVRLPKITPVPHAPSYVEGVTNLRGNVLPIINSRKRFGMPAAANADNSRVIVVELNGAPTGLIFDAVREVMHVSARDIEQAPTVVHSVEGQFLKGIVRLDGGKRLVLLLDHETLLRQCDAGPAVAALAAAPRAQQSRTTETSAAEGEGGHEQLVTFRLADEEYGIPITDVQEIIRVPRISPVPNAPVGVIGIASLRSRLLPVLDLRTRFGFSPLQSETEELCTRVRGFESAFQETLADLREAAVNGTRFDRSRLRGQRDFDRWCAGLGTTDRLLLGLLAPAREEFRVCAETTARVVTHLEAGAVVAAQTLLTDSVSTEENRLYMMLEKLYAGLTRREDERCLVVQVGGRSLALRVDAVNQVLQAPRSLIESTPPIFGNSATGRDQVRGIAKMDNGKRLIMLLAADKLVSEEEVRSLESLAQKDKASEGGQGQGTTEDDERQLVSFKVAGEEFAIDIMQVQEIIRLERVTRVPQAPDYVEGIVNLRGSVLPVIDLRKRVHMTSKDYNDATRVVVVDLEGRKTGIIVDAVSEVMRVVRRSIEPAPAIVTNSYGDHFIEGVGKLNKGERMFLLLRADKLLADVDHSSMSA